MKELVNRVAQSSLVTLNLEELYPEGDMMLYDLVEDLYKGMLLKEREFRPAMKNKDWSTYKDAVVCVVCSVDTIIPMWAYMLVSSYLEEYAAEVFVGTKEEYVKSAMREAIDCENWSEKYEDGKIILRGCSNKSIPADVYSYATQKLRPVVSSLMFGEACSAVPIYKRKRVIKKK